LRPTTRGPRFLRPSTFTNALCPPPRFRLSRNRPLCCTETPTAHRSFREEAPRFGPQRRTS
jgi:hypothetical protein